MTLNLARGQALAYGLGGLVTLLLMLAVWFTVTSPRVTGNAGDTDPDAPAVKPNAVAQWNMPPMNAFSQSSERPLFSETREPLKVDRSKQPGAMAGGANAGAPQVPLNVTLGGVIMAPNFRLAMVTDNSTGKVVTLREGMPMPGDLGGWKLREIERAKVTFNGGESLGDTVVELRPFGSPPPNMSNPNAMLGQMPQVQPPQMPGNSNVFVPPGMQDADAQSRAEEIRRKVEQRRQELRDEAARLATEKKQ
jgi:general secretion pathway protein N